MPAGNDPTRRDQRSNDQSPDRDNDAARQPLNGTTAPITEDDLLGIVEATISPARLRAIRDELANDKQLLARLARMKRDRECLEIADADTHAPPTLVQTAMARAAGATLGFDALAELDAAPAWPTETPQPQTMSADDHPDTIQHPASRRVSPDARGARARFGWQAKAALAASVLLVVTAAIAITAMTGALDPEQRGPARAERPSIRLADLSQRDETIDQEIIDNFDTQMLQREQLTRALADLIASPGTEQPALAELDLDEILRNTQSIDEMLAAIADDLLESGAWDQAFDRVAENGESIRRIIDAGGINPATIGHLARAGRLHVSLESRDPTRAVVMLITPGTAAARRFPFTAELIDFAEMDAAEWTAAAPIARAGRPGSEALASPLPNDDQTVAPADAQLARVHQLLREIRERDGLGDAPRERTDPVYRVSMAQLRGMDDAAAGQAVIDAIEQLVSAGDRISFYEVMGADPAAPGGATADGPGFTMQVYVRGRQRDR